MPSLQISLKNSVRWSVTEAIKNLSLENRQAQSKRIAHKVLSSDAFKKAKRISIYLSTEYEVETINIVQEMFRQNKQVFVPTYGGNILEMVRLHDMDDFDNLPVTKWNIKQPSLKENRENALSTGGLDLFLIPGVAFSHDGGRLGHGKGYYDKYLLRYFTIYPEKFGLPGSGNDKLMKIKQKLEKNQTVLIGLAFQEQIVDKSTLPLDDHDFLLDLILSSDGDNDNLKL